MARHPSLHPVLARFDRELGIESVPRPVPSGGGAPAAGPGVPFGDGDRGPAAIRAAPGNAVALRDVADVAGVAAAVPAPVRAAAPAHRYPPQALVAPRSPEERGARLAELESRHAETCPHCLAATGHTRLVFGEGSPSAEVMFVGEAPGETEDRAGRPFVGRAGEKLDEMIRAMGLRREDVYIANVLKSRPPDNRTPMPDEVARCGPFLVEQILAVRPRAIVALGGPAAKWLCGIETGITRARGIWHQWTPPAGADCPPIPVMPTYHPAYVLRTYTHQVRSEVWSDLRAVLSKVGREPPARAPRD